MGLNAKPRDGWVYTGDRAERMTYDPVRGSHGTVTRKIHPVTFRLLFHAVAWNAMSLEPLVNLWTTDRTEAATAVERAFR